MSPRTRHWVARGLIVLGIAQALCVVIPILASERLRHEVAQRLEAIGGRGPRGVIARANATRREVRRTGIVGRIEIPSIGLSEPVVEATSDRALLLGVGHVRSTPYPGEPDNVALAGHRDTQFRRLREVGDGDLIYLDTPDGEFLYRVDTVFVVRPSRVDLLESTGRPMLTLVTCYPFHWIGPAPKRYIVRASQLTNATAL